jgi:type IX secretion system PorP/SprF family membrane protein
MQINKLSIKPGEVGMKQFLTFLVILILATECVFGQFDARLSQYMFNAASFNPAAAGQSGMLDVSGQHRLQWIGMPNGGQTTFFNLNSPFKLGSATMGAGLNFMNDRVGLFVNQGVHLQNAFRVKVGKGTLNIGTQIGFLSIGFRGDSARGPQVSIGDYHDISGDNAIPKTALEGFGFDASAGLWYTLRNYYAGISYTHLTQPVITWSDEFDFTPSSSLYLTGGFSRSLNNPKLVLKPSFLLQTDFNLMQIDLSAIMQYDNQYWGGLSYRFGDAVVIIAGINIMNGLSVGYAFDMPVSRMLGAIWGSHEVMLSYQIEVNTGSGGRRKNYKSIRIL